MTFINICKTKIGGFKMNKFIMAKRVLTGLFVAVVMVIFLVPMSSFAANEHTTKPFTGVKVNGGTVTHTKVGDMKRMPMGLCQTGWSSST
jgi:hypothetical protein